MIQFRCNLSNNTYGLLIQQKIAFLQDDLFRFLGGFSFGPSFKIATFDVGTLLTLLSVLGAFLTGVCFRFIRFEVLFLVRPVSLVDCF